MATQRKTKKQKKSKTAGGKPGTAAKRLTHKKTGIRKKKSAKKKLTPKKTAVKRKTAVKKATGKRAVRARKKRAPAKSQSVDTVAFPPEGRPSRSGAQSGDLQGLSSVEGADSESVGELLEEGNTFEADVVKGVEDADSADEREVRTHQVPEDDIPEEYLDRDK